MADLLTLLTTTTPSTFTTDEPGRLATLTAAKSFISRLQTPSERMLDLVFSHPTLTLCLKCASDLNLFPHLPLPPSPPINLSTLSKATNSDPALLRRILRVLVCGDILSSPGPDTYACNAFSAALREKPDLRKGIEVIYATSIPEMTALPAFLRFHNYRNPRGTEGQQAWEWIHSLTPTNYGNLWEFMRGEAPEKYAAFNGFLGAVREGLEGWTEVYPIDGLVKGWRVGTVFCVDVGGGVGRDLGCLAEELGGRGGEVAAARLVLQETRELISSLAPGVLHPRIEAVVHDFFSPQPVKGARVYFLRNVLSNWADFKAREILLWLKTAMTPGYSRVLIVENQMPENPAEAGLLAAALDIDSMAHFSASQRTESEWQELIEGVGLTVTGFKHFPRRPSGAIEVEL